MSPSVEEMAKEYIPAEIRMFSGCRDEETSADVSNVKKFSLPDPAGKAGGACTSAMLEILYKDHEDKSQDYTFQEVLLKMRESLSKSGFKQIPQLSSSRPMNAKEMFNVIPENFTGTRRAVMIGINYTGMVGELSGCQNDCNNMISYIKNVHGFKDENITVLMDDGDHIAPTKANILNAYRKLVSDSEPGDAVFCHFAGHGSLVKDLDGDEDDGYDETLIPIDYQKSGQIVDDVIFRTLVAPMSAGVTMTVIIDCCHSGTVLDLPFVLRADESQDELHSDPKYIFPHMRKVRKDRFIRTLQKNPLLVAGILVPVFIIIIPLFFRKA